MFCKPTDTHQYLHKKSCHPWHTKKAIPYSQVLRYRRICSEDRFFEDKVGELAGWLKDRGYEESPVDEQIDKARKLDRATLLNNSGSKTKDQGRGGKGSIFTNIPSSTQWIGESGRETPIYAQSFGRA